MNAIFSAALLCGLAAATANSQELLKKPDAPAFAKFNPVKAPESKGLILKKGDRLAICGDSITEQKMYSRVIETYLTVAAPELEIAVRQYGWSGEVAPGFLQRMTNDCLRFQPTIATTCYGMNDHGYRPYESSIGDRYRASSTAIVQAFKNAGTRVILGSPGCVGKMPTWTKSPNCTVEDLNLNLCELRNIDIDIAQKENVVFADVFWPMFTSMHAAHEKYGAEYAVAGKDGVHPAWSGSFIMAYSYLKAMGLDGRIGSFEVDLAANKATASQGHEVLGFKDAALEIRSSKYPFCAPAADVTKDDNIRSGMTLVPFNEELNQFILTAKNGTAKSYKVTWGSETHSYPSEALAKGVNLAADFSANPFSGPFKQVDEAVAQKQDYETRQIKTLFHGPEGAADMDATAALTEKARAPRAEAIKAAFKPVTHTIRITAE